MNPFSHFTNRISARKLIFFVLLLTAITYSNIVKNPFVADDPDFFLNWQTKLTQSSIHSIITGDLPPAHLGTYRPVRNLFIAAFNHAFYHQAWAYHLFSLIIHLANTFLVFQISQHLTKSKLSATITSLLFGLHPIHVEAITFITASFDALAYTLFFVSFYLFITTPKAKLPILISATLAFLSNELTYILPAIFFLYLYINKHKPLKKSFQLTLPSLFIAITVFLLRQQITQAYSRDALQITSHLSRLLVSFKAFWLYLAKLAFPFQLSLSHSLYPHIPTFSLPSLIQSQFSSPPLSQPANLLFIASPLLLLSFFTLRRRFSLVSFASLWITTTLLPTLNLFFPGSLIFAERYAYLASFGFCLLLAMWLARLLQSQQISVIALGLLLTISISFFYATKTYSQNRVWRSDITLWQQAIRTTPTNPVAHLMLARAYHYHSHFNQAIHAYQSTLQLEPSLTHARLGLLQLHLDRSNCPAAQTTLQDLKPFPAAYTSAQKLFCQACPCDSVDSPL